MPNMYQCRNSSKCISKYRLNDGVADCYFEDDEEYFETNDTCKENATIQCYECQTKSKLINYDRVRNGRCDCPYYCDDEIPKDVTVQVQEHTSFPIICDGFIELSPITIDDREETDETDCGQWQCNNIYTHCNGIWNCLNGADELNCSKSNFLTCASNEHACVSLQTNKLECLPIEKANDGVIDCLGATDEPLICRAYRPIRPEILFYCASEKYWNCTFYEFLCNSMPECDNHEDERFCGNHTFAGNICEEEHASFRSDTEAFFCEKFELESLKSSVVTFTLIPPEPMMNPEINLITKKNPPSPNQQRCNRGIDVRIWSGDSKNITVPSCFCPPNYYGDTCQYQHQRVSLTLQLHPSVDVGQIAIALIIFLIEDEEKIIHSYEQLTYVSKYDCDRKFNIYLLYATQPKDTSKNYSIHIDAYEKESLNYRASWLIPLNFTFLPVHRAAVPLTIPKTRKSDEICSGEPCINGRCTKYMNDARGRSFCLCKEGWSGRNCTIFRSCNCSLDSICVGITANNQPICVCRPGKFGLHCLLQNQLCQVGKNGTCQNGGLCVTSDERLSAGNEVRCTCLDGFSGSRCEKQDTQIQISFHKKIVLPQSMFVHFIRIVNNSPPQRTTIFKKIPIYGRSVTIYWGDSFHLVFVELLNGTYYLSFVQKVFNESLNIINTVTPSHFCPHISELFNDTFAKLHLLRRIKYYHVPCQNRSLSCYYDDVHLCICMDEGYQRLANCFEFDHHMKYDCFGEDICENGAKCFSDNPKCPQKFMCQCAECFYGTRCQLSTNGFSLSLEAILGYHIRPYANIILQSKVVKFSVSLTVFIFAFGLINGLLSILVFVRKELQEMGCGQYLLGSSITSLIITILLPLKVGFVILTHTSSITNEIFLKYQCMLLDYFLRVFLCMDQWFNACIATERAFIVIKGVNFNKKMSKQASRWVMMGVIILAISTIIHDPIYRRLMNDEDADEPRIWCITTYSYRLKKFDSFINIFHLIGPFAINVISALIIIFTAARRKDHARPNQKFKDILFRHLQEHKHLLISASIIVALLLPRLIISFMLGCMKSARDPWLILIGYFISFIPPKLTFVIFVLPSDLYKKEFYKAIQPYRRRLQQLKCKIH